MDNVDLLNKKKYEIELKKNMVLEKTMVSKDNEIKELINEQQNSREKI